MRESVDDLAGPTQVVEGLGQRRRAEALQFRILPVVGFPDQELGGLLVIDRLAPHGLMFGVSASGRGTPLPRLAQSSI